MRGEGDVPNMATVFRLPDDDPDYLELLQLNDNGPFPPPILTNPELYRRHTLGFYRNFNDVNDDYDYSTYLARKLACTNSPYVVALSCERGEHKRSSSGIIVEFKGTKKILTSSYITFGGHSNARNLKVEILFHNGKKADGKVSFVDELHGIALIHADLDSQKGAFLSTELVPLNVEVMSLGRNYVFGLMASRGKIQIRKDNLVSDDLMSCSCTISESGIGGPILNSSSGQILGMNVYMQNKSSLFMPSTILNQCLEQLLDYGRVVRPWLGMKTRSITEIKLDQLELIYQSFPSTDGIIVDEVISGSPAEMAGVCTGDLIISCNGISVRSPVQFTDLLLRMGKSHCEHKVKRGAKSIEVEIQRPSTLTTIGKSIKFETFTPSNFSKWPDLPLDVSDNNCGIVLFSSQVENCGQNVKNRAQEIGSRLGGLNNSSNLKTRNGLSSKFHVNSINHRTTWLHPLDPHPPRLDPHMKFTPQDAAVIHRDASMHHQFPTNMDRQNLLPHSSAGFATFDHPIPPPVLQQMHMAGNHPPPHLIRGFPNAAPMAGNLSHSPAGFVQEHNPMHAFPFGQRQPNFGGPGMMPSGPEHALL